MKNLILKIYILFLISLFSIKTLAVNNGAPYECYTDIGNGKVKQFSCANLNMSLDQLRIQLSSGNPLKVTKLKHVCVYKDSLWQRGYFWVQGNGDLNFTQQIACSKGISKMEVPSNSEILGPTVTNCSPESGTPEKISSDNCTYTEGHDVINPNSISVSKREDLRTATNGPFGLVNCYRKAGGNGVAPGDAHVCSNDPRSVNYCDFVTLPARNQHYKGKWWVQYRAADSRKMTICKGGVSFLPLADVDSNSETGDFDDSYTYKVPNVSDMSGMYEHLKTNHEAVAHDLLKNPENEDLDEVVTRCLVKTKVDENDEDAPKLRWINCANNGCAAGERCNIDNVTQGDNPIGFIRKKLNENSMEGTKNLCFIDNGKWYILTKTLKSDEKLQSTSKNHHLNEKAKPGEKEIKDDFGRGKVKLCRQIEVYHPN